MHNPDIYRVQHPGGTVERSTYAGAREVFRDLVRAKAEWAEVWEISDGQASRLCSFKMER